MRSPPHLFLFAPRGHFRPRKPCLNPCDQPGMVSVGRPTDYREAHVSVPNSHDQENLGSEVFGLGHFEALLVDVYVREVERAESARRLTDDPFAERSLFVEVSELAPASVFDVS